MGDRATTVSLITCRISCGTFCRSLAETANLEIRLRYPQRNSCASASASVTTPSCKSVSRSTSTEKAEGCGAGVFAGAGAKGGTGAVTPAVAPAATIVCSKDSSSSSSRDRRSVLDGVGELVSGGCAAGDSWSGPMGSTSTGASSWTGVLISSVETGSTREPAWGTRGASGTEISSAGTTSWPTEVSQ